MGGCSVLPWATAVIPGPPESPLPLPKPSIGPQGSPGAVLGAHFGAVTGTLCSSSFRLPVVAASRWLSLNGRGTGHTVFACTGIEGGTPLEGCGWVSPWGRRLPSQTRAEILPRRPQLGSPQVRALWSSPHRPASA